jgi:hypothetical protein
MIAIRPPVCQAADGRLFAGINFRAARCPLPPFAAPKIAFGNHLLTTIGVWLEG